MEGGPDLSGFDKPDPHRNPTDVHQQGPHQVEGGKWPGDEPDTANAHQQGPPKVEGGPDLSQLEKPDSHRNPTDAHQQGPPEAEGGPGGPKWPGNKPGTTAQECFTDATGVRVCFEKTGSHHNSTDVHKQDGVNDLHSDTDSNRTAEWKGVSTHTGPHEPQVSFTGKTTDEDSSFRDAHDDENSWADHAESSHDDTDAYSSTSSPGPGEKDTENIWAGDQHHTISDEHEDKTTGSSDDVKEDSHRSIYFANYGDDRPGTKHDESGNVVVTHVDKAQSEEHKGEDTYDYHSESSSENTVSGSFDSLEMFEKAGKDFLDHRPGKAAQDAGREEDEEQKSSVTHRKRDEQQQEALLLPPSTTARHPHFLLPGGGGEEGNMKGLQDGACGLIATLVVLALFLFLTGFLARRRQARRGSLALVTQQDAMDKWRRDSAMSLQSAV